MDLKNRVVWQQACGDTDRDYSELCLRWGVILNGPGNQGAWPGCIEQLKAEGWSSKKISDLGRFAEQMSSGDIVVLRLGTAQVIAVGELVGDYEWREEFGDVDGWDLQHVRRVKWLWSDLKAPKSFPTYALKLGDTTQTLNEGPVKEWVSWLQIDGSAVRDLAVLPSGGDERKTSIEEISEFLFDHGVASSSITNLVNEIGELIRIANWYKRAEMVPSEHETVAYLVVPLLRALGWTPQRMAVEWKNVDLALFEQLPRTDEALRVVVEAKRMNNSCLSAKSQAMTYAQGKNGCERLIVTDGLRYGVFVRCGEEAFKTHAYMNLTRLRRASSVYDAKGAEEALLAMAPEWKPKLQAR